MNSKYLLLLLAVFAISFTDAYITALQVDQPRGQIYITADNKIYEVDDVSLEQNGVHTLPAPVTPDTLFVGKSGNKAALFAYLDDSVSVTDWGYFKLPLGNKASITTQQKISLPPGISRDNVYDNVDRIAVLSVSRNLTLLNMNSVTVMDSFRYYQNRVFGINMVYNRNNNHVIMFNSRVPINAVYGLSVDEWDITTGKFVEVETTYNCLCGDGYNKTASPFYEVVLDSSNCEIDYTVNPAQIWCSNSEQNKLISFNAANLAEFNIVKISKTWGSVAWDFPNKRAFLITSNLDQAGTDFTVTKINLNNGNVVGTYVNTQYNIDSTVFAIDRDQPHLYIAIYDPTEGTPERFVSLNTNNMSGATVVTLDANFE